MIATRLSEIRLVVTLAGVVERRTKSNGFLNWSTWPLASRPRRSISRVTGSIILGGREVPFAAGAGASPR